MKRKKIFSINSISLYHLIIKKLRKLFRIIQITYFVELRHLKINTKKENYFWVKF